ncbi:metal ABC transporter permease [Haloferula sp. A504]|uniref:metal ABC transporter permease n=1 Tax=Haloferula sp. A504 TaxID=3373601 RepID=UPI0031C4180F|nr:metal ABC transporter permease [Verrucomicrobiaceae bacterium E54]
MSWSTFDTWIVVAGALCAVACALPGCFLVLRRMSMMGDAISHAVLPGLAAAFLLTGSRTSLVMFVGAAIVGVLTAVFTQWISRFGNVDRGAAMGIVFTTMFAVGLIMIVQAADRVDLDPGCVLYGALELTPLDTWRVAGLEFPRVVGVMAVITALNLGVIAILFKELRLSTFDPGLSDTLGFSSQLIHYLLMTMVAVTTVAAFEAVGSIIVIAMLIVPAATALLVTRRLVPMLVIACGAGVLAAAAGHWMAVAVPAWFGADATSSSGMMAVASGLIFALAWLFGPAGGLLAGIFHRPPDGRSITNNET